MSETEQHGRMDHIAIIDDDEGICRLLSRYLGREGFDVVTCPDAEALWTHLESHQIDLALVDLNLPGEDGLSITRRLKQQIDAGIIILTGKTDEIDRVVGLEIGADDYVSKPFSNRELLARMRSVLRRVHELRDLRKAPAHHPDNTGIAPPRDLGPDLVFDIRTRSLKHAGGQTALTELERDMLTWLTDRPDQPISRAELSEEVVGRPWDPEDRSIDVHIANLRRKLDRASPDHKMISTVRGVGYMFQKPA